MANLPVISIQTWRTASRDTRLQIAAAVDDALRTFGFLLISDHGVSDTLAQLLRGDARRFFELDEMTKRNYVSRVGGRGWIPPGAEANSYASGVAAPPDLKESFKIGLAADDDPDVTKPNVWPAEVPDLAGIAGAYAREVWLLAIDLFTLFEQALDLAPGALAAQASAAASSLNLNYYPSLDSVGPAEPGQFRIAEHTDFGVLTILDRQLGYGGLQIRSLDGVWSDAPHLPDTLTVNIGDMLARWTGDRWRSTMHRVLPASEQDRHEVLISLVNFCGVRPATCIETLPVGGPTGYEPVLAGDYMRAKLDAIDVM